MHSVEAYKSSLGYKCLTNGQHKPTNKPWETGNVDLLSVV